MRCPSAPSYVLGIQEVNEVIGNLHVEVVLRDAVHFRRQPGHDVIDGPRAVILRAHVVAVVAGGISHVRNVPPASLESRGPRVSFRVAACGFYVDSKHLRRRR